MKLNRSYMITGMFLFVFVIQTGCQQKLPDGFPEKLVSFEVKLIHNSSPVGGAAVSFVPEENSPYLVTAYTNTKGVAKMETTMNVFSQSGVPSGIYRVIVTHIPVTRLEVSNAELGKMSNDEVTAYHKKIKAAIDTMPHPVPKEWGNIKTTPVKITVPEKGGSVTIEITDPKTHQQ